MFVLCLGVGLLLFVVLFVPVPCSKKGDGDGGDDGGNDGGW